MVFLVVTAKLCLLDVARMVMLIIMLQVWAAATDVQHVVATVSCNLDCTVTYTMAALVSYLPNLCACCVGRTHA